MQLILLLNMSDPATSEPPHGTLFLVVGPSGAGKDTLLEAARNALATNPDYVFPVRDITRPADAGGEIHHEVSPNEFAAKRAAGGYALCWNAHGLSYGIDADIVADLSAGRHVVCNVSRGAVEAGRHCFQPLQVVVVTASLATLAQRIAARGRESAEEVEARLVRAGMDAPQGPDVAVISNDGSLDLANAAFLDVLLRPRGQTQS
jgi:phosphonate metabolism protein PhnN/1,5-bisphosphokinase (PRPP-forming)